MHKTLFEKLIIIKLYLKLLECTKPENLSDTELISNNICDIKAMKPFLSSEIYTSFIKVIDKHINPIIEDNAEFLSVIHTPDIGFFNDKGHFEIKGDYELKLLFAKLCQLSLNLKKNIVEWACSELSPYFG